MTISLKVRVPKLTEDDILLNTPLPIKPEDIVWAWRMRGFRAQDIVDIVMMDKQNCILTYWDHFNDEPKRMVVKEPFDQVMLKWELAENNPIVFDAEEEEETTETDSRDNKSEDDDD